MVDTGGHMNIHLTPTTASGLRAAEQRGRNHFENQKIRRRLRGHRSIIHVQSNRFQKSVVNSQNYFPRLL